MRVYACICMYICVHMPVCAVYAYIYAYIYAYGEFEACVHLYRSAPRIPPAPVRRTGWILEAPGIRSDGFRDSRHQNRWIWELQVLVDWFSVDWFSGLCFIACMVLWASPGECGQSQAILQTANEVIGWPLSRFFFKGCCGRVPESAASPKQVFKPLTR